MFFNLGITKLTSWHVPEVEADKHLTVFFSLRAVNMRIILTFCSQTILQKSAKVLDIGPWVQMKSLSVPPP